jgi:hypothetical protein
MPTFDTSMYHGNPLKSVSEYSREMAGTDFINSQVQQNQLAMQGTRLKNEQMLRLQAEHDQMVNALRSGQHDISTEPGRNKLQMAFPNTAPALIEQMGKGSQEFAKAGQASSAAAATDLKTKVDRHAFALQKLGMANDPVAAQQWIGEALQAGVVPFDRVQANLDQLKQASQTPEGFAQWKAQMMQGGMTVQQQMEQSLKQQIANQPQIFSMDGGDANIIMGVNKQKGTPVFTTSIPKGVNPSVQLQSDTQMAVAGMKPGAGTTLEKPPAGYRWTADGNQEAVPGGPADLKKTNVLNQDMSTLTSSSSALDRLALTANQVLNHPGLPNITGIPGAFPNIPGGKAADAEAQLNVLKSQVAFGVLQDMRNNSKTGGALGNVSDAEGKRLEANLAALEKAQSFDQFQSSLKQIIKFTEDAKNNLRKAYNTKHGDKPASESAAPVPVRNDADYLALPSGTRFITPDGKTGTKK